MIATALVECASTSTDDEFHAVRVAEALDITASGVGDAAWGRDVECTGVCSTCATSCGTTDRLVGGHPSVVSADAAQCGGFTLRFRQSSTTTCQALGLLVLVRVPHSLVSAGKPEQRWFRVRTGLVAVGSGCPWRVCAARFIERACTSRSSDELRAVVVFEAELVAVLHGVGLVCVC